MTDYHNLGEGLKWEAAFCECDAERFGVTRAQFFGIIACYEVCRPTKNRFGIIT